MYDRQVPQQNLKALADEPLHIGVPGEYPGHLLHDGIILGVVVATALLRPMAYSLGPLSYGRCEATVPLIEHAVRIIESAGDVGPHLGLPGGQPVQVGRVPAQELRVEAGISQVLRNERLGLPKVFAFDLEG